MERDKDLIVLWNKMMDVYKSQSKRNNNKFVFQFFKDLYSIVQFRYIGRSYDERKTPVRLHETGYPIFITKRCIKRLLNKKDKLFFLAVSNMLAVYRIIP